MNETIRSSVPTFERSTRKSFTTTTPISPEPASQTWRSARGEHHRAECDQRPEDRQRRLHQVRAEQIVGLERHARELVDRDEEARRSSQIETPPPRAIRTHPERREPPRARKPRTRPPPEARACEEVKRIQDGQVDEAARGLQSDAFAATAHAPTKTATGAAPVARYAEMRRPTGQRSRGASAVSTAITNAGPTTQPMSYPDRATDRAERPGDFAGPATAARSHTPAAWNQNLVSAAGGLVPAQQPEVGREGREPGEPGEVLQWVPPVGNRRHPEAEHDGQQAERRDPGRAPVDAPVQLAQRRARADREPDGDLGPQLGAHVGVELEVVRPPPTTRCPTSGAPATRSLRER